MVDVKAGSAADDQLAGGNTQVAPTRRRAIGKLPHQASLSLTLTGVVSSGSSSSAISSGAISSIDGAAAAANGAAAVAIVVDSE